jgi:hypothetical protein
MTYFYHGVPEEMKGEKLMPLSQMLKFDPELRDKYLEKYKGREEILERKISLLNCLWDDVVQLLPLHPQKVFECQRELGLIDTMPDYTYFKIDVALLDTEKTVVVFKTAPGEENVTVNWLKDVKLDDLQEVPIATRKYYESMVGKDEPVFNYQFVPHIVYKGSIDISTSQITAIG